MKKNKVERYGAIDRTFEIKLNKPPKGLRVFRVIVLVLLIAVVVGSAVFVSFLFIGNDNTRSKTSAEVDDSALSEELLRVVSKSKPLEKDYVPQLKEYSGYSVSVLCDSQLKSLLSDAEKNGINLRVESGYVSYSDQNKLYIKRYSYNLKKYNLTEVRAQAKTEAVIPKAGDSEAQTGLLVTFTTDGKFDGSEASLWLRANSVKYGFILRYPSDKTNETSMDYNPKAYRYVGKENAEMMQSLNKTLNEYVVYINSR